MKHLKSFKIFEAKVELDNSFLEVLGRVEDLISYEMVKNPRTDIGDFVKKGGDEKDIQKIIDDLAKETDRDTNISKLSVAKEGGFFTKYVEYTKEGETGKQKMKITKLIKTLFGDKYDDKLIEVFNNIFQLAIENLNTRRSI